MYLPLQQNSWKQHNFFLKRPHDQSQNHMCHIDHKIRSNIKWSSNAFYFCHFLLKKRKESICEPVITFLLVSNVPSVRVIISQGQWKYLNIECAYWYKYPAFSGQNFCFYIRKSQILGVQLYTLHTHLLRPCFYKIESASLPQVLLHTVSIIIFKATLAKVFVFFPTKKITRVLRSYFDSLNKTKKLYFQSPRRQNCQNWLNCKGNRQQDSVK